MGRPRSIGSVLAGDQNDIRTLPDPGRCPPNVGAFAQRNWSDAQRLASALGHDVTPTEVLAVAGNESSYGSLENGFAK